MRVASFPSRDDKQLKTLRRSDCASGPVSPAGRTDERHHEADIQCRPHFRGRCSPQKMKLINKDDVKAFVLTVLAVAVAQVIITPLLASLYAKVRIKTS